MKVLAITLLFVCAAYASGVVDLTPDNFSKHMDGSQPAFIEFYAPWCGHCKKLAPEYEIVGEAFNNKPVLIARVDCDMYQDLCANYDVSGYPTLKWFATPTESTPYSKGRTAEEIISFVNGETGLKAKIPGKAPSLVVELTNLNFDEIISNTDKPAFVKFFAPWCGHCKSLEPTYEEFARVFNNEDVIIARIDCDANRDTCQAYEVSGYPTLKWFPADRTPQGYDGARNLDALVEFVNENSGTKRTVKGLLDATAGHIEEFHSLIGDFFGGVDRESLMAQVNSITESVGNNMAKVYKRAFEKLHEDSEYATKEIARLQRMIDGGALKSTKIDEFTQRINILSNFLKSEEVK